MRSNPNCSNNKITKSFEHQEKRNTSKQSFESQTTNINNDTSKTQRPITKNKNKSLNLLEIVLHHWKILKTVRDAGCCVVVAATAFELGLTYSAPGWGRQGYAHHPFLRRRRRRCLLVEKPRGLLRRSMPGRVELC